MGKLSNNPFDLNDLHTLFGQLAIWLMLAHAIWATVVVRQGSEKRRIEFHTYSLMVWMFWLIPYIGGMWMGEQVGWLKKYYTENNFLIIWIPVH